MSHTTNAGPERLDDAALDRATGGTATAGGIDPAVLAAVQASISSSGVYAIQPSVALEQASANSSVNPLYQTPPPAEAATQAGPALGADAAKLPSGQPYMPTVTVAPEAPKPAPEAPPEPEYIVVVDPFSFSNLSLYISEPEVVTGPQVIATVPITIPSDSHIEELGQKDENLEVVTVTPPGQGGFTSVVATVKPVRSACDSENSTGSATTLVATFDVLCNPQPASTPPPANTTSNASAMEQFGNALAASLGSLVGAAQTNAK